MGDKEEQRNNATQPTNKRYRVSDSPTSVDNNFSEVGEILNTLSSINTTLSSLDARISLVEVLHKEFQCVRESLEFNHAQTLTLIAENKSLKETVSTLTTQMETVLKENKAMKETVLDLQSRSMRDNLVFSGISEGDNDDAEKQIKRFISTNLHIPPDTVKDITFHRVHRIGTKNPQNKRPRPIVAKFEHFKHKQIIQRHAKHLQGTNYGINDQFPREIMDRRKILFPIRRKFMQEKQRAIIKVDKLYIDGKLYRDEKITPWLF